MSVKSEPASRGICNIACLKRYKQAMIRTRRNQKVIPTPITEVGETKLTIRYSY